MRNNFIEILGNKVEIPIIQRDYAQGRTDNKTNKIRKDFLDVLFDFINQKKKVSDAELELDFIYGFNEEDTTNQSTFIPIDGQQRLTTLWLLYWYVSSKEPVPDTEKVFLSNFLYETRHSTTEFCERLIQFKPEFSSDCISGEIKNQSWYFETWDYDPSIRAMLIVMDDIEARYANLKIKSVWRLIEGTACPFYFYKLDMDKVGLTDDLYIKMNSRGKALTEFEYFKASFADIIINPKLKSRFEKSIDGIWMKTIWSIVFNAERNNQIDFAQKTDNAFLNLFNYITAVIAFKQELKSKEGKRYSNTVDSTELLDLIYSSEAHQISLFNTLDAICKVNNESPGFWNKTFYYDKEAFTEKKTRLFFTSNENNLLLRCLFHYDDNRGLTFPEQLLLHACFIQFQSQTDDFETRIRIVRNLVANSENELRENILGLAFKEIEAFIISEDLNKVENFKTDQIEEEKEKQEFLKKNPLYLRSLRNLEDSDIFQGSISIIPFDNEFDKRAVKFLEFYDEDDFIEEFSDKANSLLCFGDYCQDNGTLSNLLSPSIKVIRKFFTTPGYNKGQFITNTRKILLESLDFFIANPENDKIVETTLKEYKNEPKNWIYYFLKYPSFRENCKDGYFKWYDNDDYRLWKLHKTQFNGYSWDPFLHEIDKNDETGKCSLENYTAKLLLSINRKKILISSLPDGFLFEDGMLTATHNSLFEKIKEEKIINKNGRLPVKQDSKGFDLEDRIKKLQRTLEKIINL